MKRVLTMISVVVGVLLTVIAPIQTVSAQGQGSSSGLSITPRKNYVVEPGKTVTDTLRIGNLNRELPLNITLKMVDFTFIDESGTPKLLLKGSEPTPWSLKPFVKLPDTIQIKPGETKTVPITISVPAKQGAGSYYSAIQYATGGAEGGNVNLNASGVTLSFLSVPGVVKEDMKLEKFGAFQRDPGNGPTGKYLKIAVGESPSILAYSLKNEGNVAESPAGSMTLKDMFGNTVATIEKINPNNNLALIGQTRRFEACIKPIEKKNDVNGAVNVTVTCDKTKLMPGRYTASMQAYYGQNGNNTRELTGVTSFWYLPIWFIIAFSAALLIIVFTIWRIVRKIKGLRNGTSPTRRR